jgi:hypothetical protein
MKKRAGNNYLDFFWNGVNEMLTLTSQKQKEDPPTPRLRRAPPGPRLRWSMKGSLKL